MAADTTPHPLRIYAEPHITAQPVEAALKRAREPWGQPVKRFTTAEAVAAVRKFAKSWRRV